MPGSGEPTGSSSISGLAFGQGGSLPAAYDGALFFCDYSRDTIWVMYRGANGLPDPTNRALFFRSTANPLDPVNLEIGPGGKLYFPDFDSGTIRRIEFVGNNRPPVAVAQASPTTGPPGRDGERSTAARPATRTTTRSPTPGTWTPTASSTTRPRPRPRSPMPTPAATPSGCG